MLRPTRADPVRHLTRLGGPLILARRVLVPLLVLLLVTVVALAPGGVLPATANPLHAAKPAPAASYRLDAVINLAAGTADVSETVQFRNVVGVPLHSLVFRVPANVDGAFTLDAVTIDGAPVTAQLTGSVLELPLAQPLAHRGTIQADLRFRLAIPQTPGRLAQSSRAIALGYWFPMMAVHRESWDRRQFVDVGDATFSEVADFDVTVTMSAPAEVVATGERVEQDGRRSRFVASSVRDVAVAISPDYVVRRTQVGSTMLEVAAFSEARAAYYLTRGAEFLRWANTSLTPYPYPVLVVADADLPSSYGGLEYSGLIFLARGIGLSDQPAGTTLDWLYLHEILHQWFYSLVGNDQIADPWLDEAFVTYLTYTYFRETEPQFAPAVYGETIAGGTSGLVSSSVHDFPSDSPYFNVVYRRGGRFLEALHQQLGDAAFWRLIREHVETYRDRVASPRAFLDRAQAASPTPLGPIIEPYFGYEQSHSPTPVTWTLEAPRAAWSGQAPLFVSAEFPVTRVRVWLDARIMADGSANALTLDLSDVDPGEYVLLVQVWDHDRVLFERARRVEIVEAP